MVNSSTRFIDQCMLCGSIYSIDDCSGWSRRCRSSSRTSPRAQARLASATLTGVGKAMNLPTISALTVIALLWPATALALHSPGPDGVCKPEREMGRSLKNEHNQRKTGFWVLSTRERIERWETEKGEEYTWLSVTEGKSCVRTTQLGLPVEGWVDIPWRY